MQNGIENITIYSMVKSAVMVLVMTKMCEFTCFNAKNQWINSIVLLTVHMHCPCVKINVYNKMSL